MKYLRFARSLSSFFALLLAGCALDGKPDIQSPPAAIGQRLILESLAEGGRIPPETSQVLLVTSQAPAAVAALVTPFEKQAGGWSEAMAPIPAVVGRNGFAGPEEKREGDGKTPTGVYRLERAFGYAPDAPTRLSYRQATSDDLWVDDVNSPEYNRWVRRGETLASSFEEMRRRDDLYRYGVVIEYNTEPVVPGNGSAIFLHLWRAAGVPTAGCVAMAEPDLLKVLGWLDPAKQPVIIMGSEEALQAMPATLGPPAGNS